MKCSLLLSTSFSDLYSPAPFRPWDPAGRTSESDLTSFSESQLPQPDCWRANKWAVWSGKATPPRTKLIPRARWTWPDGTTLRNRPRRHRMWAVGQLPWMWTSPPQPKAGLTSVVPTALAICQGKEERKRRKGGGREGEGGRGEQRERFFEFSTTGLIREVFLAQDCGTTWF